MNSQQSLAFITPFTYLEVIARLHITTDSIEVAATRTVKIKRPSFSIAIRQPSKEMKLTWHVKFQSLKESVGTLSC